MTEATGESRKSGGSLDALLEFVRDSRGFDFTGYKRSSIERRVAKRMAEVGVEAGHYDRYVEYLEVQSEEFVQLFNTLLINVTSFFRDPLIWEHMATTVVPALLADRAPEAPLRVWCAGVASGEEAYTVAMVLARVMGDTAFKERVKIYATDVDEEALDEARQGAYAPKRLEDVPRDALERFFERIDQRYVFRKDMRRCVIFGRNDLIQDAPISRIDLLVCRNTLMYFTADTQAQILRRFHFGLDNGGVLLLGKSEMLITHSDLFTPADLKWRVFRKVMRAARRDRAQVIAADSGDGASQGVAEDLREAAYEAGEAPNLVLDASGALVMANEPARRLFGLGLTDLGRLVQDLELSYRPVELRTHLDMVSEQGRPAEVKAVRWPQNDVNRLFDVRVVPLMRDGESLGTSITYRDVTETHRLQEELSTSRKELEQAYEELQSTVEELETMNEELQSTNEELETMNDELRHRTLELNDMNSFLETILTTIGRAVILVDRQQHVQMWNVRARELWGLTSEEVEDQHLLSLDIGLPVEQLKGPVRAALSGEEDRQELILPATNRRGRPFQCRVVCLPMGSDRYGEVSGVIILMEPVEAEVAEKAA